MGRTDRIIKAHLRERFVVTTATDAWDGLVDQIDAGTLVLVDAGRLGVKGERIPVDGALYVPRDRILYMQRPT